MGRGPGVRATSANSIQIDFRYKGVRCRERISLAPTPANLKYAKRLKATIDHEIATNTFDYAKHFPESRRARAFTDGASVLRTALLGYVDSLANELQPETVDEYRHDAEILSAGLKNHGVETVGQVTRAKVRSWLATLNLSKKRIDNLLIPLRGALNRAVEDEEIEGNPLSGFKVRRIERKRETIDPFTPEEIEAVGKQSLGDLWRFWAWTGLRSGELIGLEWQSVSSVFDEIRIEQSVRVGREKQPKTRAGIRTIKMLPAAKAILGALGREIDEDDRTGPVWINPNTGARWHEDRALARAFRRDCEAAGVRYRYPYQLRHTHATWALSAGENPAWIAKQMGHTDVMMLFRVYGKWMPSLAPEAGSKMVAAVKTKAA
jgi:integrase